jgi:hypothetical protein
VPFAYNNDIGKQAEWVGFDDVRSIEFKAQYIKDNNLGGGKLNYTNLFLFIFYLLLTLFNPKNKLQKKRNDLGSGHGRFRWIVLQPRQISPSNYNQLSFATGRVQSATAAPSQHSLDQESEAQAAAV